MNICFIWTFKLSTSWLKIIHQGNLGNIKIPEEIYEEFKDTKPKDGKKDILAEWAEQKETKDALLLKEQAKPDLVARITYGGYLPNPTDDDLVKMGRDPFFLSYALEDVNERCIVTSEMSKPKKQGANKHIPDVCSVFSIRCINSFDLIRELNFTTSWNR